jgi:hypothetical protein
MSFGRLGAVGRGFGRMGAGGKSMLTGNSSTVQQYLNRLPTPLSSSDEAIVAAYIDGLVSDGVWSRLDFLHLYVMADAANWPVNLISSSFTASLASALPIRRRGPRAVVLQVISAHPLMSIQTSIRRPLGATTARATQ